MFELSQEGQEFVRAELKRYEVPRSAIIRCLYRVQDENNGWISREAMDYLSRLMDIPLAQIEEVATFYTMFNKTCTGRFHIQVCCTLSCAMAGGRELLQMMMKEAGVSKFGEVSADGLFSFAAVECLGSCGTAPMLQINRDPYVENLDEASGCELIRKLKNEGK